MLRYPSLELFNTLFVPPDINPSRYHLLETARAGDNNISLTFDGGPTTSAV
jgi:hypothetical protein